MAFELQADCYAGTWARSVGDQDRLEEGDIQEALNAALAVGDFDAANPGHHGTPEQRARAWNAGFESGDPSACSGFLDGSARPHRLTSGALARPAPASRRSRVAGSPGTACSTVTASSSASVAFQPSVASCSTPATHGPRAAPR